MPGWTATILFVFTRVAAMVFVLPGLSVRIVPWRAKLLLIALVATPVLCVLPANEGIFHLAELASIFAHEVIVGVSLALFPAVMIWGLQMGTVTLQGMTGLPGGNANTDEDLMHDAPLQRLLLITVLTIFFLCSGHRQLFTAVLNSFHWLPPGQYVPLPDTKDLLLDVFSQSFAIGVQAITPIAAALFMSLMAVAAINRILPQVGYFAVGMSVQTTVLLGSLVLCLGSVGMMLEAQFNAADDAAILMRKQWDSAKTRPVAMPRGINAAGTLGGAMLDQRPYQRMPNPIAARGASHE